MKKKQVTCKEIVKYVCGELDEHIDSPKCREIKRHMNSCPNCSAYLDSLKKTVRLYREYPHPRVAERCRKELFAVLKLGKQKTKGAGDSVRS